MNTTLFIKRYQIKLYIALFEERLRFDYFSIAFLETNVQIVRIVKGEPCIIQAKNSQVKLHIPKGIHGAVLGSIHTIHSKFLHLIPDSECVVGPMCEYSVHPFINGPQIPSSEKFLLRVPHIVSDNTMVQNKIRVRHINYVTKAVIIIKQEENTSPISPAMSYLVDGQYVNILTPHFSPFLVTAENINCCSGSTNALLYGSLKNIQNTNPLTSVKVFFSSALCEIKDYEEVGKKMRASIKVVYITVT